MNYCRRCGSPLTSVNEHSFRCQNDHVIYANPSPTVGVFLLDQDGNVILAVRGVEPGKGGFDSVGGFIDGTESIEQALERELLEETGLGPECYSAPRFLTSAAGTYDFGGETVNVLSSFFVAELLPSNEPRATDDVAGFVRVRPNELDTDKLWNKDVREGFNKLLEVLS